MLGAPVWPLMRRHPLWTIAVGAFALRSAYVLILRPDPLAMIDSAEYDALARGIIAGEGITNLVSYARPPLYPIFVAICYAIGGMMALTLAQLVISAATAPLVGALAHALSGRAAAGVSAASVVALYPWFFQWVGGLASETLFTFLLVGTLTLIVQASSDRTASSTVRAGVMFGVTALARANALVLGPPIALWWWWRDRDIRRPVMLAMGAIITLVPYAAYNVANGNGLVLASNGGGLSFYIGNNPGTARFYDPSIPEAEWRALNRVQTMGPEALRQVGCQSTATLDRIEDVLREYGDCLVSVPPDRRETFWYRGSLQFIRAHPREWAITELRKLEHYWRPWVDPRAYSPSAVVASGVSFASVLLLAVAGLRLMPRRAALFVVAVAVGSTLSSVVWNVQLRYRFAMLDPVLIAAAGEPIAVIWQHAAHALKSRRSAKTA